MRFFGVHTLKLVRIAGIQIELDYSWFLVVALVLYSLAFGFFPEVYGFGMGLSVALGTVTTLLFFSSVLLHELSHSIVANHLGLRIRKITLFIFGGVANLTAEPSKPHVEFLVALAGPVTSIALGALFFGLSWLLQDVYYPAAVAAGYLALINGVLAVFNLIPGYPLDGGRLFRAALWPKLGIQRATRVAAIAGQVVGYAIMLFGVFQLVYVGSLFGLVWYGAIGYFLASAARDSIAQQRLHAALARVTVQDLMTPNPLVVPGSTKLESFVQAELLHRKQLGALVSERGKPIGELGLEQIRRVPVQDLRTTTAAEVARRFRRDEFLKPSLSAAKALNHLLADNVERLPVLDRGRLVGVLARDDVRVYLMVRTDLLNRERHGRTRV